MKQHITPKRAKEITEDQFYNMFDDIVPREDWYKYHHKKVTIGKLIELLDSISILRHLFKDEWTVKTAENIEYTGSELIDLLWNAYKRRINK
ncbi:hypothetical protein [Paraliobacillus ryukyuensis]|uniref:hypothetical protein n=1 Tax=Paraliobacillus ryukyuensis TaxID=200904 RepID=UPI0009A5C3C1|nr:hypothetical protein [Paraliobacillus ryukyuensis]